MVLCGQENPGGNDKDPVEGNRKQLSLGASEDLLLTKWRQDRAGVQQEGIL